MSLESLYQEIILDHYRNPRGIAPPGRIAHTRVHENPNCGDSIKMELVTEDDAVAGVHFEAEGCAISKASASLMTELLAGGDLDEAWRKVRAFLRIMREEAPADALDDWGDLACLKGVIQYPLRVKCATLAWHALLQELEELDRRSPG